MASFKRSANMFASWPLKVLLKTPWKHYCIRVIVFSRRKSRTGFLKVITSADAQFSAQNQVKSKK